MDKLRHANYMVSTLREIHNYRFYALSRSREKRRKNVLSHIYFFFQSIDILYRLNPIVGEADDKWKRTA